MKRLKVLFYLTMAFLIAINITIANKKAKAQDRLPGYSEWSFQPSGEEGEISAVVYGYKEATGFGEPQSSIPADGYYRQTTKWLIENYSYCGCDWGRYTWKYASGIPCWIEGAGMATYLCNEKETYYADSNTCTKETCKATETTTYEAVTSWSEPTGWKSDGPYQKTNLRQPVSTNVYSYPLTFTINLDDGQVIKIKHGQTMPSIKVPTKIGYIFKGFFDEGGRQFYDERGDSTVVYEEGMATSLYARWQPIEYTINYQGNGGSGSTPSQKLKYDEYTTVKESGFTKSGYKFAYWQDDAGKMYSPGETIVNLTTTNNGVVNFTAVWKKSEDIIIDPTKKDDQKKDESKKDESKETTDTITKKKISTENSVVNKGDLDSENYYLIRIPQELTIDNYIEAIDFEIKGNLKTGSNLKIELPNTLYLKTSDLIDYEMKLNNINIIKGSELSENFKEIEISINHPFNESDKYTVSFPLTIQVVDNK